MIMASEIASDLITNPDFYSIAKHRSYLYSCNSTHTKSNHHFKYCRVMVTSFAHINYHTYSRYYRQDKMGSGYGNLYRELQPLYQYGNVYDTASYAKKGR